MNNNDSTQKDFNDIKYSRLPKAEKYKISYDIWENIDKKTPEIKELRCVLSYLAFFTQLKKVDKSKELAVGIKAQEQRLKELYKKIYPDDMFN